MDWEMGTRTELGCGPWWFLDIPFSFVFDTVFLPSDIYTTRKWNQDVSIFREFLKQLAQDSTSVPSADWHVYEGKCDKSIRDDCWSFMQQLSPEESGAAHQAYIFEDRNGQHAVEIETRLNGVQWKYILIYDRANRRTRVIKWQSDLV